RSFHFLPNIRLSQNFSPPVHCPGFGKKAESHQRLQKRFPSCSCSYSACMCTYSARQLLHRRTPFLHGYTAHVYRRNCHQTSCPTLRNCHTRLLTADWYFFRCP